MNAIFAETLRKLRSEKGLSQKQLGRQMFVNHSTVARWENGSRLPDAGMIIRLSECLGVDANTMLQLAARSDESPNIILVDDSSVILSDGVAVLALEYARMNPVALAVLDIELGAASGLDLCGRLLEINPRTNIVFLTAYADYSLDAWKTEAVGFLLKPLTPGDVREQLKKLRYPFSTGGADE